MRKQQLKNKRVLFLDQLIEHNKDTLMKWSHFCVESQNKTTGIQPKWYDRILNIVYKDVKSENYTKSIYLLNQSDEKIILDHNDKRKR